MAKELHALPETIVAGETLTATLDGVPSTGRTCVYSFAAKVPFSVTCEESEGTFSLTLSPAQTMILKAGYVRFVAMATTTEGGSVECVDSGQLYVEPSPLATSNYASALAAVESAIAKYAANSNKRVTIDGLSIEYRDLDELIALKSYYQSEVDRDISGRKSGPTRILSRFAW